MKLKNKKGFVFETDREFYENVLVAKGNHTNYDIIEDDAPLEVKQMRQMVEMRKKTVPVEIAEIKTKQSKVEKPETNKD